MKDIEITNTYGVPRGTLQDWKKADCKSWRFKLYHHLKDDTVKYAGEFEKKLDKVFTSIDDLIGFIDNEEVIRELMEVKNIIMMSTLKR